MRLRGRIDANQREIVDKLEQAGISVQSLANIGCGCPDILVGFRRQNFVFEIKDPAQPPSARALTREEQIWHNRWTGQVAIVENEFEIFHYIGALISYEP